MSSASIAWPLARVLNVLLMKMGRTNLPAQPRRGPQAGKSRDPHSQNANKTDGSPPNEPTHQIAGMPTKVSHSYSHASR